MKYLIRFYNYLIIIIAAFPLIGMRIEVYAIVLLCACAIILKVKNKSHKILKRDWKLFLILISYYLMALVSFFVFTNDIKGGLNDLETKASFVVFPLFIFLCKDFIFPETIKKAFISFIISNVILGIYVWGLIFNQGFFQMLKLDSHYNPVFRNIFIDNTDIHIPYFGLLYGFSCILIGHFLLTFKQNRLIKVLLLFLIMFLLLSMALFSARMAIFSTAIASFYYIINIVSKRTALIVIGVILLNIILLSFLPPIQRRIKEIISSELILPNKDQKSDNVNFRYGILYCSKEVLKSNWLIGVGLGDVQKELNECYKGFDYKNFDDFKVRQYNTHNQYLNEWITYGIFGLILFLFFIAYGFKNGTFLYKTFLILIIIGLITENLFEREIGVMLYAFFNTLFFVFNEKQKKVSLIN